MILTKVSEQLTVAGEFEGQAFEVDYSSNDGWYNIVCLNEDFSETDEHDDWHERLSEMLWENGNELLETV